MPDSISQPSDPQEVNSSVCWKPCHPKQEVLSGAVDWLDYFRVTCSVYLTSTIMLGSKLLLHIAHSLAEIPVSPFILGFPPFLSSIRPLHFTMCCPTLLSPIFPIALPTLQWWREGGCNKMLFADSAKTEAVWHPATHGTHMTCRWQRVEEKVLDSLWPPSSTPFPSLSLSLSLCHFLFFSSPLSILLTRHAVFIPPTDTFDTALVWAWWREKKEMRGHQHELSILKLLPSSWNLFLRSKSESLRILQLLFSFWVIVLSRVRPNLGFKSGRQATVSLWFYQIIKLSQQASALVFVSFYFFQNRDRVLMYC